MKDPFYSNSIYIMTSNLMSSGIGLLFWIVAARYYSEDMVGLATAVISLSGLVVIVSRLGFDQALIRFFPEREKSMIFSTTLIVTTGLSIPVGVAFLEVASNWTPTLSTIGIEGGFLFLFLVITQGIWGIIGNVFIALRKGRLNLTQNVILGLRLIILLFLITLGTLGILFSVALSYAISVLISIYLLYILGIRFVPVDWSFLKRSFGFSAGNYIAGTLTSIPILILPVLTLNLLGAGASANYYMAATLSSIISIIPMACNTALFVEGSYGEGLKKTVVKSLTVSIGLLIPSIIAIYAVGGALLSLLGKGYSSGGLDLFRLLLIANLLSIPFLTSYTILKIQKRMRMLITQGAIYCGLTVSLSYWLMQIYGLNGIGFAWIATSLLLAMLVALRFLRKRF